MTMPTLIVEIGFTALSTGTALHLDDPVRGKLDTATLAADDLFTDVSPWFVSGSTRRGATRADGPTLRYEAGTCTLTFRNDDRRFDPTNLAGPYVAGGVTQVEPLRAVRIRASYGGETWPLWRGFTDEWSVNYDGPDSSFATVTCFDAFGIFAAYDRIAVTAVGAGETTSARISRILNSISWPAEDRMIATGEEAVQATTLADNVLAELLLTADTELGEFWLDAEGRARFRSRSASYTDFRSAYPQSLFGDQPDEGVPTTVNYATNPSVETDLAGWVGGGFAGAPTLTRSNTRAMFGSWSVLGTWATTSLANIPHVSYTVTGLTPGRTYTFSVYVYVPSGSPSVGAVLAAIGFGSETGGAVDQWVRLSATSTVPAASQTFQVWALADTTAGQQVYVDALQVEESGTATAYVDGAQSDGEWDGVPHVSTSRRLSELDYGDLTLTYDALSITNQVRAARTGGTEQTAIDSGSVSAYLTRSHQRTDLIMQTDAEALMWAEQVLARRAWPELRVSALQLKPSKDPDRLWAQAYGREIGDRIRVIRRPPGGGDPIIREAWVRGIEHDLSKDLSWRTTFVLEQARDVTTITDTFTRTVSNGWGDADTGDTWLLVGASSAFSVGSGLGKHSLTAVNVSRWSLIGQDTNVHLTATIATSALATGGSQYAALAARSTSDGANCYLARLDFTTTAGVVLSLRRRVSGAETQIATFTTALTHVAGTRYGVTFEAVGTTLRARAWLASGSEPSTWDVTATDGTLTAAGMSGCRSILAATNSNTLPVTVDYDSVTVTTLHAWS